MFVLLLSCPFQSHASIDLDIQGLDGELKDNVDVYVDAIPERDYQLTRRFQEQLEQEIRKALQALGYFNPTIKYEVTDQTSAKDADVTVTIDPGMPVRIKAVDLKISGMAEEDPDFIALEKSAPKVGSILNQGSYESLKSSIRNLALKKGYFDAEFTLSKLEVAPGLNEAFIRLHFASGKRYKFGAVTYKNSQIWDDRMVNLVPFKEGDYYEVIKLGEFNQNLSSTGWFSSIAITTPFKQEKDEVLPVDVALEPAPRNKFEVGVGYSTDVGPRLKFNWKKPWVNARGNSFSSNLSVSEPEQTWEGSYKIPLDRVLTEYFLAQVGVQNINQNDTQSLEVTGSASRHWALRNKWQGSVFVRWLYSDYTQGLDENTTNLILPGINLSRTRARGGVMPYWGDKQSLTLEVGEPLWGSDISIVRLLGQTTWIRGNENHRGIVRVNGGWMDTDNFEKVPPSMRFFAGGDNSVRGYKYQSISPLDSSGQLAGGRYLATGSLEYQYRVYGNWWVAAFTDAGDAWDNSPDWKRSAGLGIRWASPVGPVRFDVAHGFENENDEVMIHFTLGPEL